MSQLGLSEEPRRAVGVARGGWRPGTTARATRLPAARPGARSGPVKAAAVVVALGVLVAFPLVFSNGTVTTIAVYCVIYMAAATAWNSFAGYSGYVSLGHAVFFGCGAYTMGLATSGFGLSGGLDTFALLPLAGAVAGAVALVMGYIALRTRRHTFVVITIAMFFTFQLLAYNLGFTHGSAGVVLPNGQFAVSTYNDPFYYAAACVFVVAVLLSAGVRRSRFGLQLFAIRDDEERARSLGVHVGRVKLTMFVLSALPVGMVGAVWAFFVGQIYPQFAFNPLFDVTVALMSFIGGLGTLVGPVLGGLVLEGLQRYLSLVVSNSDLYLIVYGGLFLAVIVLLPDGVLPSLGRLARRRRAAARAGAEGAASTVTGGRGAPALGGPEVAPTSGAGAGLAPQREGG